MTTGASFFIFFSIKLLKYNCYYSPQSASCMSCHKIRQCSFLMAAETLYCKYGDLLQQACEYLPYPFQRKQYWLLFVPLESLSMKNSRKSVFALSAIKASCFSVPAYAATIHYNVSPSTGPANNGGTWADRDVSVDYVRGINARPPF